MQCAKDSRPWLVQKYGGTSLGRLLEPICSKIIPSHLRDYNLIVVCSALSGPTKASGTTNLLLECIAHAEAGLLAQTQLNRAVDAVRDNHVRLLERHLVNSNGTRSDVCHDIFDTTRAVIVRECESLRGFLLAAQIIGELSPRAQDRVVALGETLACRVVAALLKSKDIPAEPVILENVVEAAVCGAAVDQKAALDGLGPRFYHLVAEEIARRVRACSGDGSVPIVTGFFGLMPYSMLRSVGRGYGDLCAAMCAVGTKAAELQVWKEADGIFTADPRRVPSARLLPTVTPEEAAELAYYGSEVLHPLTMDQIRCGGIPLRLKNVFNPTGAGTVVCPRGTASPPLTPPTPTSRTTTTKTTKTTAKAEKADVKMPLPTIDFLLGNEDRSAPAQRERRRRPTAVAVKDDVSLVEVACNRNTKSQGFLTAVFDRLEDAGVRTDLVTTSERSVSLAFQGGEEGSCRHHRLRTELEKFGKVTVTENMSIVTVVGHEMRNMVGVAAEITSALASAKINISMVSQGASEISVSVVVRGEDAALALNTIHSRVLQIPTHWEREKDPIKGAEARGPPARRVCQPPLTHTPRSVAVLTQRRHVRAGGSGFLDDGAYGYVGRWVKRRRQA